MNSPNDEPPYSQLPLASFLDLTASRTPAPGGGAALAVAVALAASLSGMAARFSTDHLPEAAALAERSDSLRDEAAALAQADANAYERVLAAQRDQKSQGVREALSEAADVPLAVAGIGSEVADIAARLVEEGNPNLKGDAISAVLLADAAVRAAAALVEINLSGSDAGDERLERASGLVQIAVAARRMVEES